MSVRGDFTSKVNVERIKTSQHLSFKGAHRNAGCRVVERGTDEAGQAEDTPVLIPGIGLGLWVYFDSGATELVPGDKLLQEESYCP